MNGLPTPGMHGVSDCSPAFHLGVAVDSRDAAVTETVRRRRCPFGYDKPDAARCP